MSPTARSATRRDIVGVPAGPWLTTSRGRLKPGSVGRWIEVPADASQKMLQQTTRLVADLPRTGSRTVVWVSGTDELRVATDQVTLTCHPGLVVIGIPVDCDQLSGRTARVVEVALAVGTIEAPRGLMMATLSEPTGPAVVTDLWADSLHAFAWESLLTLAREIAAAVGHDREGRALVPVALGAADGVFLVRSMARHS